MAPTLYFIIVQIFISTVIAYASQYLQYGTPYPSPYITGYPAQSYITKPAPLPQYIPNYPIQPSKTSGYSIKEYKPPTAYYDQAVKGGSHQPPSPVNPVVVPKINPIPTVKETPKLPKQDIIPKTVPPFDSNILNNLAIALQLLIVSNLIHNPPPKIATEVLDEDVIPAIASLPIPYVPNSEHPSHSHDPNVYEYQLSYMPNANFIGTSSFGDTGISKSMMSAYGSPTMPKPRPTGLMSPYDAIGPNSPFTESSRKESPKSPYHLSSDYNDLFSLTELFKV